MLKLLDILRIAITAAGFFFGYKIGFANGYDPVAQLHFMIPVIIVAIAGISGIEAELTLFFTFIFFFIFSRVNHAYDAVKRKNYKWQNINRPFITLLLIAGMAYPVIMALKMLP